MSRQSASVNKHRIADLFVLLVLAGLVSLYCVDAVRASRHIYNLILVLPVTGLVLVLCLVQFVISLRTVRSTTEPKEPVTYIVPVVTMFAAYILTLPWLGFDIGTFLFIATFLWAHGERRWTWLVGYSVAFSFLVAIFFSKMLPYPMPMLILSTAY